MDVYKSIFAPVKRLFLISLLLVGLITGCSEYQKVLKSTDLNLKLEKANEYYAKKNYYKALPLYEELVSIYRGTSTAEEVYYKYAYCEYYLMDLYLASYRFENFNKTFPNSKYREECTFMAAYCDYLMSPKSSLEQSSTYDAIRKLQLITEQYPNSKYADSSEVLLDELRFKLETKAFDNAYLYYKTEYYESAVTAFKNVLKRFPDTEYREEVMFGILKSNYKLAVNSIESKKQQRFKNTMAAYIKFADSFPESSYLRRAEEIYEEAKASLEEL